MREKPRRWRKGFLSWLRELSFPAALHGELSGFRKSGAMHGHLE